MNPRRPVTNSGFVAIIGVLLVSLSGCGPGDTTSATSDQNEQGISAAVRDGYGPFRATASVTVDHPDSDSFTYVVTCEGNMSQVQGTMDIDADAGCAALADAAVQQRLIDGPSSDRTCTQVYGGPDTAVINGNINGKVFRTTIDRTDGCGIADWDNLLGALLIESRSQ